MQIKKSRDWALLRWYVVTVVVARCTVLNVTCFTCGPLKLYAWNCRRNASCGTNSSRRSKVSARKWSSWRSRKWNLTCRSATSVSRERRFVARSWSNRQVDVSSTLLNGSVQLRSHKLQGLYQAWPGGIGPWPDGITNYCPSVLWHCWLGYLTRKNRPQYDQWCIPRVTRGNGVTPLLFG